MRVCKKITHEELLSLKKEIEEELALLKTDEEHFSGEFSFYGAVEERAFWASFWKHLNKKKGKELR